jgi:hypothetical protein
MDDAIAQPEAMLELGVHDEALESCCFPNSSTHKTLNSRAKTKPFPERNLESGTCRSCADKRRFPQKKIGFESGI